MAKKQTIASKITVRLVVVLILSIIFFLLLKLFKII
jgi:hypothetical protein